MIMDNIKYHRENPTRKFDLNKTLYETVKEMNANNKNGTAITFFDTKITYGELQTRVDRLADAYSKAGIKEGDVVAIATINMPIVQENLLALNKIGAISKWIDLRIKEKDFIKNINESNCKILVIFDGIADKVQNIASETNLEKIIVASPKNYLNPVIQILANIKDKREGKTISLSENKLFIKYEDFLKTGAIISDVPAVTFIKDKPSIIVQSSGSTGIAKSIVHTDYNFNSTIQKESYTDLPLIAGQAFYNAIPPFIIYGLCGAIYLSLGHSMNAVMTPYVSETILYDDLGKYNIAAAAPLHFRYMYNKIVELQTQIDEISKNDTIQSKKELKKLLKELNIIFKKLEKVHGFASGGDKINADELLKMQHIFNTPIVNCYGNNELAGAAIINPLYSSRPSSIGYPLKGIEVKSIDLETQLPLRIGEEGEICIHSDSIFQEYLNNESETKRIKKIDKDGKIWIHTGDLGYIDSEGFVYITGRAKRLIKREAFKIAPETIENAIMQIEEVKDCCVVGVRDLEIENSQVPLAYIELHGEYKDNFEEIKKKVEEKCYELLPDYELPYYIVQIDKIPYHNTKKKFKELELSAEEYVENTIHKKYK